MNDKMNTLITVNLDAESIWSGMLGATEERPKTLSMGGYGIKRGLDRVLAVLKEHEVKSTFFVPGVVAETHPDAIDKILDGGHEIAMKGHTHRAMHTLTDEEIREEFEKATEVLTKCCGVRPIGFRAPEGEVTEMVFTAAKENGYLYSSSLYDNDMPYQRKGLLEIPMNWDMHDFPYFAFNYGPSYPIGQSRVASYKRVEENYIEEMDAYDYYKITYVAQFTPQSIGSPGKIMIMKHVLEHMETIRDHMDIMTCAELYQNYKENRA